MDAAAHGSSSPPGQGRQAPVPPSWKVDPALEDVPRDMTQRHPAPPGRGAQPLERHARAQAVAFAEDALGLLDLDPALQGLLGLRGDRVDLAQSPAVQQPDRRTGRQLLGLPLFLSSIRPARNRSRYNAPTTSPRRCSGSACTDRKPSSRARRANLGHRYASRLRSAEVTAVLVRCSPGTDLPAPGPAASRAARCCRGSQRPAPTDRPRR